MEMRICNRRRFLQAGGLGALALAVRPGCLEAGPKRRKLSLAVVSDTHVGYRGQPAAARQWEQTAAEIATSPAELVLHLGDVVDQGQENQYPVYLKTRERIRQPVHEIPGNHDPEDLFEKYLRRPVNAVVDHHWLRFLLLNDSRTDSHDGFLSKPRLDWIEAQCQKAAKEEKFLALCLHVPVHSNRHPDRGWYVKPGHGQREFYELLKAHQSRILCLMHGHFHNGLRGWEDHSPVQEICFPSALYNRDRRLEAQGAPGYNLVEFRPGYTLITLEGETMLMEYQPVGAEAKASKRCQTPQIATPAG